MQLDPIDHRSSAPGIGLVVVVCYGGVSACVQSRSERRRDAALECIACNVAHLMLDLFEALSLALPDLDREQLEEVAIIVRRCGTGSFRTIEQSAGDVEPDGARSRCGTSRRICRPHPGGVYERGDVSGK